MTEERWQEVKAVLESALQLDSAKRNAYLDQACSSDPSLRPEIESLLAAEQKAGSSFLEFPPVAKKLELGTQLGDYEIESLLGAGGMGEVYRARDLRLRRHVAIKVLPAVVSTDPERLRRFEQEATAAAALSHPNILAVHQLGTYAGAPYLVSELLEGETLREQLRRGRIGLRRAVDYSVQIARGLAAAHAKGIIHRDIKPENLFVTKDGVVKILDFGLAKYQAAKAATAPPTDVETQPMETAPGSVMGTVGYMSPEQVRGQMADARSDLFSLGLVLYEMVSGKRAFTGDSTVEVMNAILKQEPPEVQGALPSLDRIIRRCLEKKPEERFQSASDLAFALESLSGSSERKAQRDVPQRRYSRLIALAAGAIVLVATGAFVGQRTTRAPMPSFQRITYRRGYVDNGRFANGGRTIVYSASWDGNPFRVFSTQKESPESRDLGIANARVLAVSPSDEMALNLTQRWGQGFWPPGTLARSPVSGGTPRELTNEITAADWTSDGKQLAVVRVRPGFQQLEFPIGHVLYQTTGAIGTPRISPKADVIAFLDEPFGGVIGSVATVDMKGDRKTLTQFWGLFLMGLAWSSRGDEILFTASDVGLATSLYAVNRSGRQRLIAQFPGTFAVQDAIPDGRLLLARLVQSGTLSFLPGPNSKETDLYWHDFSLLTDISRDGKALLFSESGDATRAGEDYVTYLRRTDGSPAVRLGPGIPLEISPDGKWALVLGSSRAPSQLVLLPTGTGETRQLTHDAINHQGAAWTPDGKRIVFVGNEPGHRFRYYVQNLDGSAPRAITPENESYSGLNPVVISPDGRFVAVAGLDGGITLYPLDGGVVRAVPTGAEGFAPLRWCQGNSLMVYEAGNVPVKVLRLDIVNGAKTLWRELAPNSKTGLQSIDLVRVGADCQSSAYSALYNASDLWIADGLR